MTLSITSKTPVNLGAWKQTFDGVEGYIVTIGGNAVFLDEKQADELGRYLLFETAEEPKADPLTQPTQGVET
jgi:hypothetical protein